ncbi:YdbH domain-containing protein [Sphingomonas sp. AR_OL41]|uniref:intermembrane phospholipid transport protein YdbH family protein n=1 Tax=Sphingomonas sp. AR_OL41 TaxID=3042729 RepID=UPI00248078B3|nr:YdbH domain-containing protein [Sphingomonas sp. AR_OL41]MDH7973075.1 YdbH domain-containing protein [Sphingomonas sp. AR_OL41]
MTPDDSDMPDAATSAPRRRRARAVALALLALLLLALLVGWTQRKPIASSYIDGYLAGYGVPARYKIADLGFGRQRLTDVVIGPAARPDLIADWIELRTHVGIGGVVVDEIRTGHARLRATLVQGKLSLGAIDRLLPAPSGKPFALPAIVADIADARVRLETPQGVIGLKIAGFGRLDNGFRGQVAAVADTLGAGGCTLTRAGGVMRVQVLAGAPKLTGPVRLGTATCGTTALRDMGADLSVSLSPALDHWDGKARVMLAELTHPAGALAALDGTITGAGSMAAMSGDIDLASGRGEAGGWRAGTLTASAHYRVGASGVAFDGKVGAHLAADAATLRDIAGRVDIADGTPLAPLARKLTAALAAAGRDFGVDASVALRNERGDGQIAVSGMHLAARSGAQLRLSGGKGVLYRWRDGASLIDGTAAFEGGGLPTGRVDLAQRSPGGPISGTAVLQPYAAGDAQLSATPIRFAIAGQTTRVTTQVTLSGPVGDGRVEGLSLPIDARWNGRGGLLVNPACAPLSFRRVALSGVVLQPASVILCPRNRALFSLDHGVVGGGAHLPAVRLAGSSGSSPLILSAASIDVGLAGPDFTANMVAVRLGAADSQTRLDIAALHGGYVQGNLAGRFDGGAGRIGAVPLLLSKVAGDWNFKEAVLSITGGLNVDDAAVAPRFKTLVGRDVRLALKEGVITATGNLVSPEKNVAVAQVALAHDLSHGTGRADLTVPAITFSKAFQPKELTGITDGVIEEVNGTVAGEGHIRWTPQGVTSDGVFRTAGTDLAAAFGPVTGIAGEIRFTDLLNLESAPGQVATIKSVNPGVAVQDGTIRYQTLPGARIRIEDGRWPFAGGSLVLDPTLLDFDIAQKRRMTFRVTGMDAGQFLQQFDFKNLNATGTFDGTLPMVFDQSGGRIEAGQLKARPGGGSIAYLGEITERDVGFWGNLAFQALKALNYRDLDIVMNGPLAGDVITEVHFAGVSQGAGAKRNFLLDRLQKLPFVFNLRITAPFRSLVSTAEDIYDPRRLIERNLPALIEEQNKRARPPTPPPSPVQPSDSRTMP